MKIRSIALAAALAAASIGAQAALTTYAPWGAYWPNGGQGQGIDNVLFNVQTVGNVTVAMGAHGYKNGEFLPNNGTNTYYAKAGTYPAESDRANWSFDFAWDLGNCTTCSVKLEVDTDPTAGVNLVTLFNQGPADLVPNVAFASWNMEMPFVGAILGYNFDPFSPSSTAFSLSVTDSVSTSQGPLVSSDITVNVPEPGSLALAGLGLAGLALMRRRSAAK